MSDTHRVAELVRDLAWALARVNERLDALQERLDAQAERRDTQCPATLPAIEKLPLRQP